MVSLGAEYAFGARRRVADTAVARRQVLVGAGGPPTPRRRRLPRHPLARRSARSASIGGASAGSGSRC